METDIEKALADFGDGAGTDAHSYSPLVLAYLGDAVFEVMVRTMVVSRGNAPVGKLHRQTSGLVRASAQARMIKLIEPLLDDEEMHVFKRGRNAKSYTAAKNASIVDYRLATGFEALIGFLYLRGDYARLAALVDTAIQKYTEEVNG